MTDAPRRVVEEAIATDDGGEVLVRRGQDAVNVSFSPACGDATFTHDQLSAVLHYIETFGYRMWLLLIDSGKQRFVAHVESNELLVGPDMSDIRRVPWEHLRASLLDALGGGD